MAGIYIHIPYCRQACHYCDFHFSTSLQSMEAMHDALLQELALQCDFLAGQPIGSVYFGGGTPSMLTAKQLTELLAQVAKHFPLASEAEITVEANPDDMTPTWLNEAKVAGINRLSVGIQTFHQPTLQYLNRAHNATQAINAIRDAKTVGFDNLSLDLMFGLPHEDDNVLGKDLEQILAFRPTHISAYCLTIEQGTAFGTWVKKGQLKPKADEVLNQEFDQVVAALSSAGYEHYEVSNYSLPGHHAIHNTNYWLGVPYLGIGPAAHSYNGKWRQSNVRSNAQYIKAIAQSSLPAEIEVLTQQDRFNELLLTRFRTKWGVSKAELLATCSDVWPIDFEAELTNLVVAGLVLTTQGRLFLTPAGRKVADAVTAQLMWV